MTITTPMHLVIHTIKNRQHQQFNRPAAASLTHFTLITPSLGVIPCEYCHKWYTAENQILRATFHL